MAATFTPDQGTRARVTDLYNFDWNSNPNLDPVDKNMEF